MFKNKKILVTGGSGMIGRQLVKLLENENAEIHVADLNKPLNMPDDIIFHNVDLKNFENCNFHDYAKILRNYAKIMIFMISVKKNHENLNF